MTSLLLQDLPVRKEQNFKKVAPSQCKILKQAQQYIPLHNTDPQRGIVVSEDENLLLRHFYQFQCKTNIYYEDDDQHLAGHDSPGSPQGESLLSPAADDLYGSPVFTDVANKATKRGREDEIEDDYTHTPSNAIQSSGSKHRRTRPSS